MRTTVLVLVLVIGPLATVAPATASACPSTGDAETLPVVTLPGVAVDRERRSYDTPGCSAGSWRLSASVEADAGVAVVDAGGGLVGVSWFEDRRDGSPYDEHAAIETPAADAYWDQQCTGPTHGWAGVGVAHPLGFLFQSHEALCAMPRPSETGESLEGILP